MPRGKYKRRAQKRDTARTKAEQAATQAQIDEENRQLAALGELETELDYLTSEALKLREVLDARASEETVRLRAEIGELLREIVQLTEVEQRGRRRRDRRFGRYAGSMEGRTERIENLLEQVGSEEGTLTFGVHVKPGMTAETVRKIQRARGWRKR